MKTFTKIIAASLITASAFFPRTTLAQPSSANSISFQGALTGAGGQSLANGNYNLTFKFYTNATTLTALATSNVPNVPVSGGLASTSIPVDPEWFRFSTHLGVAVNSGPELLPRVLVTAVPLAMYFKGPRIEMNGSNNLAIVFNDAIDPTGTWTLQTEAMGNGNFGIVRREPTPVETKSFVITSQGNVGIGIKSPLAKLDVNGSLRAGGIAGEGPTFGEFSFHGSYKEGVFHNFRGSGNDADCVRLMGGGQRGGGYGYATGPNIESPIIWMYGQPGNAFEVRVIGNPADTVPDGATVFAVNASGVTQVKVLTITGGADLAEHLSVNDGQPSDEFKVEPGMVVSIDPSGNRKFKLSDEPYDRKRVGIISGGNGVQPGLILRDEGNPQADGEQPIALTGQVWCHADATFGPITPGDLLTTSSTPGHAMKVTDDTKARFTVLGQALTGLKEGRGWVQVLVGKQ